MSEKTLLQQPLKEEKQMGMGYEFLNDYGVSQKISPEDLWQFLQNDWEFFNQILHAYYAFLSMLDYKFLFKYLQL